MQYLIVKQETKDKKVLYRKWSHTYIRLPNQIHICLVSSGNDKFHTSDRSCVCASSNLSSLKMIAKNVPREIYLQLFEGELMSYLLYLCLFAHSGVQCILCCVFVLFAFVLCTLCCQFLWIVHFRLPLRYSLTFIYLVYPMLPFSLNYPF